MVEADGGSTCQLSSVDSVPAWEARGSQFWVEVSPTAQERQGAPRREAQHHGTCVGGSQ